MSELQDKIRDLQKVNMRRGATFVADFEAILGDIAVLDDPASVVPLLAFFEDKPPEDVVMFSIVHTIENHSHDVYMRELLRGTAALLSRSRRWARILYMRILNVNSASEILAAQIPSQPAEVKLALRTIFEDVQQERPQLSDRVQGMLQLLQK